MKKQMGKINSGLLTGLLIAAVIIVAIIAIVGLDATGKKGSGLSKEYIYDIEGLGKIDPVLILYEQFGKEISTGFSQSKSVFVDNNELIYVAGDKSIRIFESSGRIKQQIDLNQAPYCLTISNGRIYVGLKEHIEVFNMDGQQLAVWPGLGNSAVLTSIAVFKKDAFAADAGNRVVVHYDTDGNIINYIGKKDNKRNIPGFVIPSPYFDLAVSKDGLLRVVNPGRHRIETYTFDGDLEFWWGKASAKVTGFCGCCNPINFAILGDESFVTYEKGLVRVKIYDADGLFTGVVAGPEQLVKGQSVYPCDVPTLCQKGGFDVAADKDGRIYVLDTIKNTVKIFCKKLTNDKS